MKCFLFPFFELFIICFDEFIFRPFCIIHFVWEDEKAKRELELAKKEDDVATLLEEAEKNAEHLKELEEKVNEIPSLLEKEYARGRKEATAEVEKENKYATELLKNNARVYNMLSRIILNNLNKLSYYNIKNFFLITFENLSKLLIFM